MLENELIREAIGHMEKAAYTKEQLMAYDKFKIDSLTAAAMLNEAEEKGKKQGIEIGKEQGIEIGVIKTAVNFLNKGVPIETVCDATGLSKQQIEKLFLQ